MDRWTKGQANFHVRDINIVTWGSVERATYSHAGSYLDRSFHKSKAFKFYVVKKRRWTVYRLQIYEIIDRVCVRIFSQHLHTTHKLPLCVLLCHY